MLCLTEKGVDVFIKRYNNGQRESFWNNYDLLIWNKDHNGYTSVNGLFKNNSWGLVDRISISSQGTWKLSKKYVKYFR
jgi:hypothetical protein